MSQVIALMSMSLDGYVADPDDGVAEGSTGTQQLWNAGLVDELSVDVAAVRPQRSGSIKAHSSFC